MYDSETWTAHARQEKRLNSFHLRSIRRILGIPWQDRVSNTEVLSRANLPSIFTLLRQRRLRCWGISTAWRMTAPKKTFSMESWHLEGDPKASHNCATRMSAREAWKHLTSTPIPGRTLQPTWRSTLNQHPKTGEKKLMNAEAGRRACRKEGNSSDQRSHTNATFVTETVSPTSVSSATSDAGTIEQTRQTGCTPMVKLDRRRPYIEFNATLIVAIFVQYKIACLCFQCICQNSMPPFISDLLHPYCPSRTLFSLDTSLLTVPSFSLETFGNKIVLCFGGPLSRTHYHYPSGNPPPPPPPPSVLQLLKRN